MSDFRDTLYTIDKRGNRRWVYNAVVDGTFRRARKLVIWVLLLFYLAVPWITVGGTQGVLLDIANRKFTFFGATFWATDSFYLFLILACLGLSFFFFTSLLGRVWCGWACPQTVFLDFVFRPLEALIEGGPVERRRLDDAPWGLGKLVKKGAKFFSFTAVAWVLASTALAYFVGREPLLQMMTHAPTENLYYFVLTCALMVVLLFHFGWFREQFCTVLCPYARFQSVLLDPHSLLVGYDRQRGEPRGKKSTSNGAALGDCIDCGLCVRVCPTGIDIRNGLQLECVQCASCIDACDSIMRKLDRPTGLVRYATEEGLAGRVTRMLRPRVVAYGVLLFFCSAYLAYSVTYRITTDAQIIRSVGGAPFSLVGEDRVSNQFKLHLANESVREMIYTVGIVGATDVEVVVPTPETRVSPGSLITLPLFVLVPRSSLNQGKRPVVLSIAERGGHEFRQTIEILGPG